MCNLINYYQVDRAVARYCLEVLNFRIQRWLYKMNRSELFVTQTFLWVHTNFLKRPPKGSNFLKLWCNCVILFVVQYFKNMFFWKKNDQFNLLTINNLSNLRECLDVRTLFWRTVLYFRWAIWINSVTSMFFPESFSCTFPCKNSTSVTIKIDNFFILF